MADRGTAVRLAPPSPVGLADALTISRFVFSYPQQFAVGTPPTPKAAAHYRLAGTQQLGAGYIIPSVGQLWPRGARGEVSG